MRRSGLETIRRLAHRLLDEIVAAEADGGVKVVYTNMNPKDYNPKKPWDYCFRMSIDEESPLSRSYWKKNVEQPCNKVNTQNAKVSSFLDLDQQIAASPSEHIGTGGLAFDTSGMLPPTGPTLREVVHKPPKQTTPVGDDNKGPTKSKAQQGKDGLYYINNKGNKICAAFNKGQCKGKCNLNQIHQCNKCLKNDHAAHTNSCGSPAPNKVKKGKGNKGG